jgi:hypothetical protein
LPSDRDSGHLLVGPPALDVLQYQRQAQRDGDVGRIGALPKLLLDVTPRRTRSAIFRQMLNQFARVGERAQRHDRRDDERARQPPRPIRAFRRHGLRLSGPASGGANRTSSNATGIATERASTKQNEATRNCSPEADSTDKSASGGTGGDRTKRLLQNLQTAA